MKTYLAKFQTNYEEGAIILTTSKGLEYAKEKIDKLGAWPGFSIEEINTKEEGVFCSANFGECSGKLNN